MEDIVYAVVELIPFRSENNKTEYSERILVIFDERASAVKVLDLLNSLTIDFSEYAIREKKT